MIYKGRRNMRELSNSVRERKMKEIEQKYGNEGNEKGLCER